MQSTLQFQHRECPAPVALAELLAANVDDAEFCAWARAAKPGDTFRAGGGAAALIEVRALDLTAQHEALIDRLAGLYAKHKQEAIFANAVMPWGANWKPWRDKARFHEGVARAIHRRMRKLDRRVYG